VREIVSTYRLQLTPEFGFDAAAAVVPYLARLGVTHLYCSPWLQTVEGSQHGYDVIDHSRVSSGLGGQQALDRLVAAAHEAGLGIVLDIVPNHMSIEAPESQNKAWWSVLRDGPLSPYAAWFDIDWVNGDLLVPVLGGPLASCVDYLVVDGDRIRYFEHEFPYAEGTLVEGDILATLDKQHYRLADWRVAVTDLRHRRFFDVTTLAGVRVEDPVVFAPTHERILKQVHDGTVDGLRVDHPDGLADPGAYLQQLHDQSGGAWIVAEKILEHGEQLPAWPCAGTTGYDALNLVLGLFVDPAGEQPLTSLWESRTGTRESYEEVVERSKRDVLDKVLNAELERLALLAVQACNLEHLDVTQRGMEQALTEVLVAFDVYRDYGAGDHVHRAVGIALEVLPERAREIELIGKLALSQGPVSPEFVTRFQQTCGPVMAKGVEDTTFYRYLRLSALNEVGGDPGQFGVSAEDFHAWCVAQHRDWPRSMTTLSTHDTKRSEDVRARLVQLAAHPREWADATSDWSHALPERLDAATEELVWQSAFGAWPIDADRLVAYVEKATREAKTHTSWTAPDADYDARVQSFVRAALAQPAVVKGIEAFVARVADGWRTTVLGQKLVQLTMPGVADTYQGCELVDLSLVDPDNRRPVSYDRRRYLLDSPDTSLSSEKLRLVSTVLPLRRANPTWFLEGSYEPLEAEAGTLAFCRDGQVVTVVPLRGGIPGDVQLPDGDWVNLLVGLPVQLWVRR
jgi:(1->4)-alpha-D-glucan 1-alpha-D-glucosylmutase